MNRSLWIIIFLIFHLNGHSQAIYNDFDSLVKSFGPRVGPFYEDSINIPLIYEGKDFSIKLADSSMGFETKSFTLQNPYNETFPLSYSVIYNGHIISLFEPGYFACYRLTDLSRNNKLAEALNKKKFKSHWIIDKKLHGLSKGGSWYVYSDNNWKKIRKIPLPANFKSDLMADKDYLIYSDCNGEWGGTIYFYNRKSKEVYFTSATCANTVIKDEDGYNVLSQLGHGFGSADLKVISDPSKLPNLKDFKINKRSIEAIGYADTTGYTKEIFGFYGIQIFSMFNLNGQTIFLVHWQERTFLAQLNGKEILIIDPLFNSDLYTHNPITKKYGSGEILLNLDFWGIGGEREVSLILIQGKEITKIDWNESRVGKGESHP